MKRNQGLSMLELLLALSLLMILSVIAIPNTLEAEARSRVSRARYQMRSIALAIKAYQADYDTIPCDNRDMVTPPWRKSDFYNYSTENPTEPADLVFLMGAGNSSPSWMKSFYTKIVFVPLTTPVAYVSQVPIDSFSRVVPLGYDTREVFVGGLSNYAYAALFSSGPDRTDGNWYRGINGQGGIAMAYDPSNGVVSSGDIIRPVAIHDEEIMKREVPFW